MNKDYYKILDVEKSATHTDVKKAFRKLAQKYHPDRKTGNEAKFKEVSEAYSVIGNEQKRKEYDSYGKTFGGGQQQGGGFDFSGFQQGGFGGGIDIEDILRGFGGGFGQQQQQVRKGRDISMDIEVSFKDSIFGTQKKVLIAKVSKCSECDGSGGKKGTSMSTCAACNGQGKVHQTQNSFFGAFQTVVECIECVATGKVPKEKCKDCRGAGVRKQEEEITVTIPAGINAGEMIRMGGLGEAVKNGTPGDLYIKVHVTPHELFKRSGVNLVVEVPLKLTDALSGTVYNLTTLEGKRLEVKISPLKKTEETLRVKGYGVPQGSARGDIYLKLSVSLPQKLSSKAKDLVSQLKEHGL
ncbi:DnaJ domain-containing protein [Candidatus Wolfebacteria bacterium]|nr:DnaJ domain-containing protein [Candidatus Wolfebacteria bacterium]